MSNIKEVIQALILVREQRETIDKFAREEFEKKYSNTNDPIWYKGFEVISDNEIEVKYGYGEDFQDRFSVNLEEIEEGPYDYFGLLESWQIEGKRIEPRKEAMFEGCGDRALEGVMFIAKIEEDGNLSVRVDPESEGYFNTLNTKMWLKLLLKQAQEEEFFYGVDDDEEFHLVKKDGTYSVN